LAINGYLIAASVTFAAATLLTHSGNNLAILMEWSQGFVGTQFLAIATSLPEVATAIMAIRQMKPDLAVANLFGSNLFNTCVVLFGDDVVFTKGSFLGHINSINVVTCLMAIIATLIITSFAQSRGTILVKLAGGKWLFPILIIGYIVVAVIIFRG
jgi:cation:H+ antiporter